MLTRRDFVRQVAAGGAGLWLGTKAGRPTKPESLGHREYFIMYRYQDTRAGQRRPCAGP